MHQAINDKSSCSSGVAFCKYTQFSFRYNEFRCPTIHTDNKLREYEDGRLVNAIESRGADSYLPVEFLLAN